MSIPLDRLYNYLNNIVNDDITIYRFKTHGSKKIEDLTFLDSNTGINHEKMLTTPIMIFHDQEPLTYQHYSIDEICNHFMLNNDKFLSIMNHPKIKDYFQFDLSVLAWVNFYDKILIVHSELNSSEVKKFEENNFLGVYFWSHALIAKDWYRYAEHDPMLTTRTPKKLFLVYNRAWSYPREYRLKFAEMVIDKKLVDQCMMKFNPHDSGYHYQDYHYKNKNFQPSLKIEDFFDINFISPDASADYSNIDYQETQIEIVLETLFDDTRLHLTEKILRPIACGHPFILAGTPGSLQYLRNYGFETFHGLIDETYDLILDPVQRLHCITTEMQRLSSLDKATQQNICIQLRAIAHRNQKRFFSQKFDQYVVDEFVENFNTAIKEVKSSCSGAPFKKIRSFCETYFPDRIEEFYPMMDDKINLFDLGMKLLNSR
jgi:hypothetical protein